MVHGFRSYLFYLCFKNIEWLGSFRTESHALWFTKWKFGIICQWHLFLWQLKRQKAICHTPQSQPSQAHRLSGEKGEKQGPETFLGEELIASSTEYWQSLSQEPSLPTPMRPPWGMPLFSRFKGTLGDKGKILKVMFVSSVSWFVVNMPTA